MWEVGSEQQLLPPLPADPLDPLDSGRSAGSAGSAGVSQSGVSFEAVFKKSCKKAPAGMLAGNRAVLEEKKAPAGMLAGNRAFLKEKKPCGHVGGKS